MNVFFTCKNTLVIMLQFYRLYVVQMEKRKELKKELAEKTESIALIRVPGLYPNDKNANPRGRSVKTSTKKGE